MSCPRAHISRREQPSTNYASRYPIPSSSAQPPNRPLLSPHPFHTLFDTGLVSASMEVNQSVCCSLSVMHPEQSGEYQLAGGGYIFVDDHNARETQTWYTINTSVPLARSCPLRRELRPSGNSPLFSVHHDVHVALICAYDIPGAEKPATERLHFSLPLHFVHVTPTPPSRSPSPPPSNTPSTSAPFVSSTEPIPQADMLVGSLPYVHSLPAYSQLFDFNGERKIDYSVPLPVYTVNVAPSAEVSAVGGGAKSKLLVTNDISSM